MNEHNLRILGIAGSTRPGPFNKMALAVAAEQLPPGSTLQVFDLAGLPMYFQQAEASCPEPVSRLKAAIRSADAVLFATPEHNASIPAALKSAIDGASRPMGDNSWAAKVAAVIGATPGSMGTVRAQGHLRQIMSVLDMSILSQPELLIALAPQKFGSDGSLVDDKARALLGVLMRKLVGAARLLKHGGGQ